MDEHYKSVRQLAQSYAEKINERVNSGNNTIFGIPTGLNNLDKITHGLHYGLTVVGARPEHGLTDFGLTVAVNASQTHKVGYVNTSLDEEILFNRFLGNCSRVSINRVSSGELVERDRSFLGDGINTLCKRDNVIFHKYGVEKDLVNVAKQLKGKGVNLLILDRLQGLFPSEKQEGYYWGARELKGVFEDIVKEQGLALLVLSELKKKSPNHEMNSEFLRDFGALEYDANPIILFEKDKEHEEGDNDEGVLMDYTVINNFRGNLKSKTKLVYISGFGRFEDAAMIKDNDLPE